MSRTISVAVGLALACSSPAGAEKLSKDFRRAFEQTYLPQQTFAVVTQSGVPTTSIYGTQGTSENAHYSVDVVGGRWKTSSGWLDSDQTAADYLREGELMELASISYKDNRVDLRLVSLEAHKVTRGEGFGQDTDPEPVATNFKFFFPFDEDRRLTPADMPEVQRYIGQFLSVFPTLDEARLHSARVTLGQASGDTATSGGWAKRSDPQPSGEPTELKEGMTPLQVIEVLGRPDKEVVFQSRTKWTYPDVTVIFDNCRVSEVEF